MRVRDLIILLEELNDDNAEITISDHDDYSTEYDMQILVEKVKVTRRSDMAYVPICKITEEEKKQVVEEVYLLY
jgi:hypothetical protein